MTKSIKYSNRWIKEGTRRQTKISIPTEDSRGRTEGKPHTKRNTIEWCAPPTAPSPNSKKLKKLGSRQHIHHSWMIVESSHKIITCQTWKTTTFLPMYIPQPWLPATKLRYVPGVRYMITVRILSRARACHDCHQHCPFARTRWPGKHRRFTNQEVVRDDQRFKKVGLVWLYID